MSFFVFDEGAEGVGVVDDGFAVLAPVEKVVRRAVEQQAEAFEVVGLDVADLIIRATNAPSAAQTILDQPAIRFARSLVSLRSSQCRNKASLTLAEEKDNHVLLKCEKSFLNVSKKQIKCVELCMKYDVLGNSSE
jgi:hypothetical protein